MKWNLNVEGAHMKKWILSSLQETAEFGRLMGERIDRQFCICLDGDLGAGKTTFSKALAAGFGVDEMVTSPTFTLVQEYQGRLPFYHFDVYRLGDEEAFLSQGFDEYWEEEALVVMEWAAMIQEILPEERLELRFYQTDREEERMVEAEAFGAFAESLLESIDAFFNEGGRA